MARIVGILMFVFGLASQAQGACGLSIVANDLNLTWDMNWTIHAISISVSKTNPAACTFGLGFSAGGAGNYTRYASAGGSQLKYQIYQDSGASHILKDVPDIASANDVIMVNMPAGSNPLTIIYYFDIPFASATTPTLIPAGDYTDSFIINAYEGPDSGSLSAPPDASAQVNVTITVPKMIDIALVDTGGVFQSGATTKSIDLGSLSTGLTSRFDMVLRTNAGYSITMESGNGGRMKHVTKNSFIDYEIFVNNVLADLTGGSPALAGNGQTPLTGIGYPVRIVMGTVGALALSGDYQDTVIITATVVE